MGLAVGGIVSVGGGTGGSGSGGASSGIQLLNGQTGPSVTLVGTSGIQVTVVAPNVIHIGVTQSGVIGVNGITVEQVDGNFVVDGSALSGVSATKFADGFTAITSGLFTHNLATQDVIVQIYDNNSPRRQMFPDQIRIENNNEISVLFNTPQTGRIVII
jgi:hypothetical protein